jgi:hypothetical protein
MPVALLPPEVAGGTLTTTTAVPPGVLGDSVNVVGALMAVLVCVIVVYSCVNATEPVFEADMAELDVALVLPDATCDRVVVAGALLGTR